jgi:hypothetical protein
MLLWLLKLHVVLLFCSSLSFRNGDAKPKLISEIGNILDIEDFATKLGALGFRFLRRVADTLLGRRGRDRGHMLARFRGIADLFPRILVRIIMDRRTCTSRPNGLIFWVFTEISTSIHTSSANTQHCHDCCCLF